VIKNTSHEQEKNLQENEAGKEGKTEGPKEKQNAKERNKTAALMLLSPSPSRIATVFSIP
jgi:hypothetical protein